MMSNFDLSCQGPDGSGGTGLIGVANYSSEDLSEADAVSQAVDAIHFADDICSMIGSGGSGGGGSNNAGYPSFWISLLFSNIITLRAGGSLFYRVKRR